MLALVREGTPLQVEQLLASREASGDIGRDEDAIHDEVGAEEATLEMDAEFDISDDDEWCVEDWAEDADGTLEGDVAVWVNANPFAPRRFEIVVTGGACSVPGDEKWNRRACTPLGSQVLYELESRVWAFGRIAAWLTERRSEFLRTRDLWYLGCEALDDVRNGRAPVQQKSFLKCAGLTPRVSEASLSRYIRATDIAWADGSAPLDILFNDDARRAWVASAVMQFVLEAREQVTVALLQQLKAVKVQRGHERVLAQRNPDAMDLPTFVQKVNMLARTRWSDVVAQYSERMARQCNEI